jgi:hypothetical protein
MTLKAITLVSQHPRLQVNMRKILKNGKMMKKMKASKTRKTVMKKRIPTKKMTQTRKRTPMKQKIQKRKIYMRLGVKRLTLMSLLCKLVLQPVDVQDAQQPLEKFTTKRECGGELKIP